MSTDDDKDIDGFWAGGMAAESNDTVCLRIDKRSKHYTASAVFYTSDSSRHSTFLIGIEEPNSDGVSNGNANHKRSFNDFYFKPKLVGSISGFIGNFHPSFGLALPPVPFTLPIKLTIQSPTQIHLEVLVDDVPMFATLRRHRKQDTVVVRTPISWKDFQARVVDWTSNGYLFRGQTKPWPLRTKFSRVRRFDTLRYVFEDSKHLLARFGDKLGRPLNPGVVSDVQTAMALAQHHGYPTPFLDWSRSPFVAAYFACEGIFNDRYKTIDPTVFAFDMKLYQSTGFQITGADDLRLGISILNPPTDGNDRLAAQEGLLMYCNGDPVEMHIDIEAKYRNVSYISAYQLLGNPLEILKELRSMGKSAGTLFPNSLDHSCRDLWESTVLAM